MGIGGMLRIRLKDAEVTLLRWEEKKSIPQTHAMGGAFIQSDFFVPDFGHTGLQAPQHNHANIFLAKKNATSVTEVRGVLLATHLRLETECQEVLCQYAIGHRCLRDPEVFECFEEPLGEEAARLTLVVRILLGKLSRLEGRQQVVSSTS